MMNQIDKSALFVKSMKARIHFTPKMSLYAPVDIRIQSIYENSKIQDLFNHDRFGVER